MAETTSAADELPDNSFAELMKEYQKAKIAFTKQQDAVTAAAYEAACEAVERSPGLRRARRRRPGNQAPLHRW